MQKTILSLLLFSLPLISSAQVSFAPYTNYPIYSAHSNHVATGDFNNDGLDDVAVGVSYQTGVSSINTYKLFVYLQNPTTHALQTPIKYPYPNVPGGVSAMTAGDVNLDGLDDIVIGYKDSIRIFYQSGGVMTNQTSRYIGRDVDAIDIGDVNNDSVNDIVIGLASQVNLAVVFGETNGTLSSNYYYPAMINGGNDLEIIHWRGTNYVIKSCEQNSFPQDIFLYHIATNRLLDSVRQHTLASSNGMIVAVVAGDINADGENELLFYSNGPSSTMRLWVWKDLSQFNPAVIQTLSGFSASMEMKDLNCDGVEEVVMYGANPIGSAVYSNGSVYNFTAPRVTVVDPDGAGIADVNGDGRKDIVSASGSTGLSVLINISCPSTLPIELLSFTAEENDNRVKTTWSTATEVNNDFFTIERSPDAYTWEIVGQVTGCGTCSNTSSYDFYDDYPIDGTSYYRLKQTDYDGRYTISNPVVVHIKEQTETKAWFDQYQNMIIVSGISVGTSVHVYSMDGKLIASLVADNDRVAIASNYLVSGCYIIKAYGTYDQFSTKVIL